MKTIELTQGQVTFVDDEDYPKLSQHKWYFSSKGYAVRNDNSSIERGTIRLHQDLIECPLGHQVDHRDGHKLNNQRENLRIATSSQQAQNVGLRKDNSSGYKGVSFYKKTGKWRAYIAYDAKPRTLGYYFTPEDAARVYDEAAIQLFGAGAKTNFPSE